MQKQRTLLDNFFLILKGIAMGVANKIPGVSGGVVAFVAGFYEEFIGSFKLVNKYAFSLLIKGKFKDFYDYINGKFLWLLILGMIISFFSVSKILDYLLLHFETNVWASFFGMILGSIYYIKKDFEGEWSKSSKTALFVGAFIGLSISFFDPATENDNLIFVFFCGIISVSGMTLPGLSGSFILMLIGNYVLLMVDSVNALYDTVSEIFVGDFSFIQNSERIQLLKVLVVFSLGSMTGLVTFSHLLSYLIKKFKKITYASILGFIIGSLGVVWPWKKTIYYTTNGKIYIDKNGHKIVESYQRFIPDANLQTLWAIVFIVIGILIVLGLEIYGKNKKK
uniref:DUF368 domain-containing protein n=2 Tax=Flavobacterium sp. TaxID=239 RepID=UPI00404B4674